MYQDRTRVRLVLHHGVLNYTLYISWLAPQNHQIACFLLGQFPVPPPALSWEQCLHHPNLQSTCANIYDESQSCEDDLLKGL